MCALSWVWYAQELARFWQSLLVDEEADVQPSIHAPSSSRSSSYQRFLPCLMAACLGPDEQKAACQTWVARIRTYRALAEPIEALRGCILNQHQQQARDAASLPSHPWVMMQPALSDNLEALRHHESSMLLLADGR